MNTGSNSLCSLRDGNLQDIVNRGSLHDFLVSLHQEFGPMASFWFGRRPVVSLGSVQQLRQHINPNHSSMYMSTCLSCLSRPHRGLPHPLVLLLLSSADSFETMLKSLLGYQSGAGGSATEAVMRKKAYQGAINNTLENNFPLVLKVRISGDKTDKVHSDIL